MTVSTDPFTKVHNKLQDLLEANSNLTAKVRASNRIDYTGTDRLPDKTERITTDHPEWRLRPIAGLSHQHATSNDSTCMKRWVVEIRTGEQRLDDDTAGLLAIEWEVYRAFSDWMDVSTGLRTLTWNSKTFVVDHSLKEVEQAIAGGDRNLKGWHAVMAMEVTMYFDTADLPPT